MRVIVATGSTEGCELTGNVDNLVIAKTPTNCWIWIGGRGIFSITLEEYERIKKEMSDERD